jgi:hypothetical protein
MGDICGREWVGSLDKIIVDRSKVYAGESIPHQALSSPWQ